MDESIRGTAITFEKFSERRQKWVSVTDLIANRRVQAVERRVAELQTKYGELARNFSHKDTEYFTLSF